MRDGEFYNVGLSLREFTLLIRLIDDEDELTSAEELELRGIRRKLVSKRKQLRTRTRKAS